MWWQRQKRRATNVSETPTQRAERGLRPLGYRLTDCSLWIFWLSLRPHKRDHKNMVQRALVETDWSQEQGGPSKLEPEQWRDHMYVCTHVLQVQGSLEAKRLRTCRNSHSQYSVCLKCNSHRTKRHTNWQLCQKARRLEATNQSTETYGIHTVLIYKRTPLKYPGHLIAKPDYRPSATAGIGRGGMGHSKNTGPPHAGLGQVEECGQTISRTQGHRTLAWAKWRNNQP